MIRPRSIRARLVATYTLVATILAGTGLVLFWALLQQGATSSLDAALSARVRPLALEVRGAGTAELPPPPAGPAGPAGALGVD
nr:hypothetical protein [Actinomycetota bacterium]